MGLSENYIDRWGWVKVTLTDGAEWKLHWEMGLGENNRQMGLSENEVARKDWLIMIMWHFSKLPHPQAGRRRGGKACPRRVRSQSRKPLCIEWNWGAWGVGGRPQAHCSGPQSWALTGSLEALTRLRASSPDNSFLPFCAGGQRHAWRAGRAGRGRWGRRAPRSSAALRASHHKLSSAICPYPFWTNIECLWQFWGDHFGFLFTKSNFKLRCGWVHMRRPKVASSTFVGDQGGHIWSTATVAAILTRDFWTNWFLTWFPWQPTHSKLSFVLTSIGRDVEVASRLFYPVATPRELPYKVSGAYYTLSHILINSITLKPWTRHSFATEPSF